MHAKKRFFCWIFFCWFCSRQHLANTTHPPCQQMSAIGHPTHPPLCWRNIWMVSNLILFEETFCSTNERNVTFSPCVFSKKEFYIHKQISMNSNSSFLFICYLSDSIKKFMNSNIWNSFRENCKGDYVLDMKRYGRSENCIRSTMCSFDALIWELFGVCAKVKKSFAKNQ